MDPNTFIYLFYLKYPLLLAVLWDFYILSNTEETKIDGISISFNTFCIIFMFFLN